MNWFKKSQQNMIGYKVMRVEDDEFVSGADSRQRLPAQVGAIHTMAGNGIYLGPTPEYVIGYYSGSEFEYDPPEALITYEFDPTQITSGNLNDREWEISVPSAKVVNIQMLNMGQL